MKKVDEKAEQHHHHHHHDHPHEHHEHHHDHPHEHHEHHHHHDGHDHGVVGSLTKEQLINELNITDFGWTLWKVVSLTKKIDLSLHFQTNSKVIFIQKKVMMMTNDFIP